MKNIKLNKEMGQIVSPHGYKLNPLEKYVINLDTELKTQKTILEAVQANGLKAIEDWFDWLTTNGFNPYTPNPTNDFVSQFYGERALWETPLSQGIVVKNEEDDDYYVVMECSRKNEGFKYTQIILTLNGCL
ncbi:hypothetical protein [Holzapfeliella sp. JNUCC 72]